MSQFALAALLSTVAGQTANDQLAPRKDGPSHLRFITISDRTGNGAFFYSNTVDKSCVEGHNAICGSKCRNVKDSGDYYGELTCRFCLIRWKCLNLKSFRNCGKAKCAEQCPNEAAGPREFYGMASPWRQQECLACMLKEKCATEFDLRLHYGFTRNCVGECVSKVSESCPPLPIAERCSFRCHEQCKGDDDQNCFSDCLEDEECSGMEENCVNCIQECAATKIIVQESEERSLFDLPTLKAHFTPEYMQANKIGDLTQSQSHFGREREEEEEEGKGGKGKKKANRRNLRNKRRKDNARGETKKSRKKQNRNGK